MGFLGALGRWLGPGRATPLPAHLVPGARVRLRTPLATSQKVWIPVGATGIVVGWDARARRVSVELDTPRTVVREPPPTRRPDECTRSQAVAPVW